MIYTAWGNGGGYAHTVIEGAGPPRYGNGVQMEDCTELIWTIEADSWTEAMVQYHKLQGWEPYVPM